MSESRIAELQTLVQQGKGNGNADAVAELIDAYRPRLLNFVKQQMSASLRQKVDPEDIVQEISISCVRSVGEVDLTNRDPFDWVCHVARRRIVDAARMYKGADKRALYREVPLAGGADASQAGFMQMLVASITSPSSAFSRDQREFRLQQAIEQLPEESREALRMRYVESLPSKEIAQRLGKSDGAVRVLLTRSLKKLQPILEDL